VVVNLEKDAYWEFEGILDSLIWAHLTLMRSLERIFYLNLGYYHKWNNCDETHLLANVYFSDRNLNFSICPAVIRWGYEA
jgi:hypothetical protein